MESSEGHATSGGRIAALPRLVVLRLSDCSHLKGGGDAKVFRHLRDSPQVGAIFSSLTLLGASPVPHDVHIVVTSCISFPCLPSEGGG